MLCSLHVLYRPDHHPYRIEWAREVQAQLSPDFLKQLQHYGDLTYEWFALLGFKIESDAKRTIEDWIDALSRLPDAEFVMLILNQKYTLAQVISWLQGRNQKEWEQLLSEREKEALLHPARERRQLTDFLRTYVDLIFQKEWAAIKPWLARAEHDFYEQFEKSPLQALEQLHPRLFFKPDAIYAQKATLYRWPYEELRKIKIRASTFVHPHLLVGYRDGTLSLPLAVEVPNRIKNEEVPADLQRMFKALSDGTRLKIIRSLFLQPHCTQQLSHIHGISEAAVSKHLKLLMATKFVTTERKGNYMFYKLEAREMEMVIVYLRNFLEQ
ncbi:metalloregulator ArsR/SmtB family transcription factor [Paenibacillus sp. KN14-4R]|uniref:ArsR/SmtB family transcription factor n=1 Tax=Paenibacillus sp. KN14-4R TaxID=3445773 RepID=UPI003FA107A9